VLWLKRLLEPDTWYGQFHVAAACLRAAACHKGIPLKLYVTAHCPETPPVLGSPIIATVNSRCSERGTSACCFVPAAAVLVVAAAELYRTAPSAVMREMHRRKVI
jgi:hypothetical protein